MNRIALWLCPAVISLLFAVSCGQSFSPADFHAFVDDVEARCADLTEEDWEDIQDEYQAYMMDYRQSKLSEEAEKQVRSDVNRYKRMYLKTVDPAGVDPDALIKDADDTKAYEDFLKRGL
ncbi:MAG: hypothetical protein K5849_04775 [Bacteroidales bacterium]|nr:hypothetical protein [Bacteroidales bacterium]